MTLGHGLPEGELRGQWIVYDLRRRIEAHRRSADGIVLGPTAIAGFSEGDPGRVHHICERLRWVSPEERLCSKTQRMEHERYSMPCAASRRPCICGERETNSYIYVAAQQWAAALGTAPDSNLQ